MAPMEQGLCSNLCKMYDIYWTSLNKYLQFKKACIIVVVKTNMQTDALKFHVNICLLIHPCR